MNMKLKEIMSARANYLAPNTSLQEAACEMQKQDIGFLPIKENGNLIGVVTDRDLTIRGLAKGLNPNATVDKVMTKKVCTALETDTLEKAVQIMEQHQIRRLVILDKNNTFSGVISMGDIAIKCNDADLCSTLVSTICEKMH